MHIKNSLFLFLKKPVLFIIFFSCFLIPQAFSWWERVESFNHYEGKYEKISKYIWDPDQFPIKLCVRNWDDFNRDEKQWILASVSVWNLSIKHYRKKTDSDDYRNLLGDIGRTKPVFIFSCASYFSTNVIPLRKGNYPLVNVTPATPGGGIYCPSDIKLAVPCELI